MTTFLFPGALNLTREEFHTTVAPTAITGVACVGTESELSECSYSSLTACGVLNDAGVICQGTCNIVGNISLDALSGSACLQS